MPNLAVELMGCAGTAIERIAVVCMMLGAQSSACAGCQSGSPGTGSAPNEQAGAIAKKSLSALDGWRHILMLNTARIMGTWASRKSRPFTVCVVKRRKLREKLAWEETPRAETDSGQDNER